MHIFTDRQIDPNDFLDERHLLHKRVLTESGAHLGRVVHVHFDPHGRKIAGITVQRSPRSVWYIDEHFVGSVTENAIQLTIYPVLLLIGQKVLTSDGKVLGTITAIERKGRTNVVERLVFRRWLREYEVSRASIARVGENVMIKESYDEWKERTRQQRA